MGCLVCTRSVCLILPASLRESPALHLKPLSETASESLVKQVTGITRTVSTKWLQQMCTRGPGAEGGGHEALLIVSIVITSARANVPFRFMGHTQRLKPNSSPCRGSTKRAILTSTSPCRIASHRQRTWGSRTSEASPTAAHKIPVVSIKVSVRPVSLFLLIRCSVTIDDGVLMKGQHSAHVSDPQVYDRTLIRRGRLPITPFTHWGRCCFKRISKVNLDPPYVRCLGI
jgi:hypothetical protein